MKYFLFIIVFLSILISFVIIKKLCEIFSHKWYDERVLYNGDEWLEYRLGDLYYLWSEDTKYPIKNLSNDNCRIGRCFARNGRYHQKFFPNSIADKYHVFNTNNSKKNTPALMKAVQTYASENNITSKYDLVFHLRIGDVMESNQTKYFKNINLENLSKYPDIKHIHIIAGMHQKNDERKSIEFITNFKNKLLSRNYQVTLVLGNSPDHDVMIAYNAKYIASSGGGYGRLLIEVAVNNGGTHIDTRYS
jgi:hypothetical protein